MKICSKCGIEKDESEYCKHKLGKNGLNPSCRVCKTKQSNEWRTKNIDRDRANQRKIYYANHEKKKERVRKYYNDNKEERVIASKIYRLNNPEKSKETNTKSRLKIALNNPEKIKKWASDSYFRNREKRKEAMKKYSIENPDINAKSVIKYRLKKEIGEIPPPELVEVKLLINKTLRLCKTSKSLETI